MHLEYIHSVYNLRMISKVKLFSPYLLKYELTYIGLFIKLKYELTYIGLFIKYHKPKKIIETNKFLLNRYRSPVIHLL